MDITLFSVVQGLVAGLLYGLLALGLVLLYRTTRILNFSQGQLGVVTAVFLLKLTHDLHLFYWPSLLVVLVLSAALGALCELLLRRLFNRPRVIVMVATIGLSQVLFLFTVFPLVAPKDFFVPYPLPFNWTLTIGGGILQPGEVATLIVAPLVAIALAAFLRYTSWGLGMRAMAENSDSARLSGVWVKRMSTLAWAIAGLLSAITAILDAPGQASALKEALPPGLLLRALAAALIAGMTSFTVAFLAGIAIGIVEQVVNYNLVGDPNKTSIITFGLFALILLILLVRVRWLQRGPRTEERSTWSFGESRPRSRSTGSGDGSVAGCHGHDRARGVPPARDLTRAVVPARSRVHLRGHRLVAHGAHRMGRSSLAGPVRARRGRRDHRRAQPRHEPGAAPAARRRRHRGRRYRRRPSGAAHPGLYLAVTTLGFALFMQVSVLSTPCWTAPVVGGQVCTGLPDPASTLVARPSFFGWDLSADKDFAWFSLGVLLLAIVVTRTWRDRGVARRLIAVRDNESGAAAMGVSVVRTKLLAFALSGFMAGVAGVCLAFALQRIQPEDFSPTQSILVLSMVVIGGLGAVDGAVLGALYLVGLPAALGSTSTIQFLTSGLGVLVFLLYLPGGLADLAHRAGDGVATLVHRWLGHEPDDPSAVDQPVVSGVDA